MSEHKRIHDANRPVKPPKELFCHCGKMFTTKRELDWHTEEVHERVPKKCGKLLCGFFYEKFPKISRIPKNVPIFFENIQFPTSHLEAENPFRHVYLHCDPQSKISFGNATILGCQHQR